MSRGVSIHIAVSDLSSHYLGTEFGSLPSAGASSLALANILPDKKFVKISLPNATTDEVKDAIAKLAVGKDKLSKDDLLIIAFAGHGGLIVDENCAEDDCANETWCLHDKELLDDDLVAELAQFDQEGIRIL